MRFRVMIVDVFLHVAEQFLSGKEFRVAEYDQIYRHFVVKQKSVDGFQSDFHGFFFRITVSAGGNHRKRNGFAVVFKGQPQRIGVAG